MSTDNLISWSFTIYDHLLSDSVRNVKNVKALWEWLKYWLFVWDKFGFEKSHGNQNFGFDLLASVRLGFLKTEPKFGFSTSLISTGLWCVCVEGRQKRQKWLEVRASPRTNGRKISRSETSLPVDWRRKTKRERGRSCRSLNRRLAVATVAFVFSALYSLCGWPLLLCVVVARWVGLLCFSTQLPQNLHLRIWTLRKGNIIGLEPGGRGILTELSLCYSIVYAFKQCTLHNHNEQFFQVGLQDWALMSLGLALSPPSTSVSSDFMVLCKCFF